MASPRKSVGTANASIEEDDAFVYVFDRRSEDSPEVKIPTGGLFSFVNFKERVREALEIGRNEKFIIATTNREEIKDDVTWDIIDNFDTLYVLQDLDQELCAPAQERVNYLPHYDTIVKGGMYEYYASEGQNPLPYAFAELIDNSLAGTADNLGARKIELRLYFDDSNPAKCCVVIRDNGKGMTSRQLNNWAIYRLSKFIRKDKIGKFGSNDEESSDRESKQEDVPRSLNSDISYFGVGGKQAIFFIGNSTRMISRPPDSKDVHELKISQEEFEKKEIKHEAIYSGVIRNRKLGDYSHIPPEDETTRKLILEEKNSPEFKSFTSVVIHGINSGHIPYLKSNLKQWTRQLAHIYHYYLHGPEGNVDTEITEKRAASPFKNIDIEIQIFNRGQSQPKILSLRDIKDDFQSQLVRTAGNTFEFKAKVEGSGIVEGLLRYHPFLYDQETFPVDLNDLRMDPEPEDDHGYAINERPARGRRPTFECYWNGRLIPYTLIEDFDWCSSPKKSKTIPMECYNRVSGVLWTNDKFQVSTNKLTFIDLEMRLKDKNTLFSRVQNGHEKRTGIDREFMSWLKECHEHCDKQILFCGFKGSTVRSDLPKNRQTPWGVFEQVEWDNKTYKKGQLVKILRTTPTLLGTINRFFLFGEFNGDVFATGGDIELFQEPRSLYDDVKIVPLSKLDRTALTSVVKKCIEEEEGKLPTHLKVTWPDGYEVKNNEKRPAGKTIGDIKVEIMNKKGEFIKTLPGTASANKKLLVELKVIWHSPTGDVEIVSHISQHGKNWPYWFRKMENIKNLGNHSLILQVVLNESGANTYAGKSLPAEKMKFCVTEAEPQKFSVGILDGPFRVGEPFSIPLDFQDEYNNPTKPSNKLKPTLESSGLEFSYDNTQIRGNSVILKGIIAKGAVGSTSGKNFSVTITVPDIEEDSQTLKIRLLPGLPKQLKVSPEEPQDIDNGNSVKFLVEIHDIAGNFAAAEGPMVITCKFTGAPGLPAYKLDCSNTAHGVLTGDGLFVKKLKSSSDTITAKIDLQGFSSVKAVERKVTVNPSDRTASIQVFIADEDGNLEEVKSSSVISGIAGDSIKSPVIKLIDEAGREKTFDEKISSKIKVNWTPKVDKNLLLRGHLPDIKVPTSVSDTKYCHISVLEGGIDFNFNINAVPGPAAQMKCKCGGNNKLPVGETLTSKLTAVILDQYGNEIELPNKSYHNFTVSGEDLAKDAVKISQIKNMFVIEGVHFEYAKIGMKELECEYEGLKDYVKLEIIAGPPADLDIIDWDVDEVVTVYNEGRLPHPLKIQLLDEGRNPCCKPDVKVQIARDPKLKLIPAPQPQKTNLKGIIDYGLLCINASKGNYEIQPKAFFNKAVINGPKLKISVQPDPTKPVTFKIEYETNATLVVGGKLPDFTVKVIAEDDTCMATAKSSNLSMKIWKTDSGSGLGPPSRALSFPPDGDRHKQDGGVFYFRDRKCPEIPGNHSIMFVYFDGKHQLFHDVIQMKICSGTPVELIPLAEPGTPTVSNTKNLASRCLIRNLRLQLRDQYGNPVSNGYDGMLQLDIIGPSGVTEIPQFVGNNTKVQLSLQNGLCIIQNLTIQENSPGKDGLEYLLRCQVICNAIPKNRAIAPYDIPFLFYNDVKKQSQMAALSKEKDNLQNALRMYKSIFDTREQLSSELKISVHEAQQEEQKLRLDLRKQNIPVTSINTVENIDNLFHEKSSQRDNIMNTPRRICGLQPINKEPEVIGKIAHLALIEDSDIARVLSWHMSSDMDCVVTLSTRKAKDIYNKTSSKQQVLPIDSIYKKNLPDWGKPLPHVKFRSGWNPLGNPVYARNLLVFPHEMNNCRIVFGMLLGDTLFLDTLDHANAYRQEIVKHTHCPTILTRDGDRIRSNGKFGGLMNKALPIEKLRGAIFGQPLPQTYHTVCSQIENLRMYKMALLKLQRCRQDLQDHLDNQKNPDMQSKFKEFKETEKQLKDIEKKMGMSSGSLHTAKVNIRPPPVSMEIEAAPAKKARISQSPVAATTASLNGGRSPGAGNKGTPVRTSKRIAHMSPVTAADGKRQFKKS